jgi:predicted RND superfamily exporter protein
MLNFSLMALMHIPLDMLTLMVSSIVIGVGVDDAIHYNIHFRKNLLSSGSVKEAIVLTHMEAGRPILHTTVSIVGGLLFLLMSNFLGIAYFGLLTCSALTFTMLGTLFLLPAVIAVTVK